MVKEVVAEKSKAALVSEFFSAPVDALFTRQYIAAVACCSEAKLERDSWRGTGLPFVKFGRQVLYRKADVLSHFEANKRATAEQRAA